MSTEPASSLPVRKFQSRKGFMDFIGEMMTTPLEEEAEEEFPTETRGRPRELKTYIMESNEDLTRMRTPTSLKAYQYPTDLTEISILKLEAEGKQATFYVDRSDERFLVLYTSDLAEIADKLYSRFVLSASNNFDKIWLPTEVLDRISHLSGNSFRGFGLKFADLFAMEEGEEQPIYELRMSVAGASSSEALEALDQRERLRRSLSRSMIRVRRGSRSTFVTDELRYSGRLITKSGASMDDHVSLVAATRKIYRNLIENVEKSSIGTKKVQDRTLMEGQAFDLILERQIENLDLFVECMLTPNRPFRLWGFKNELSKDRNQVVAVDLHTGDPIDLEVTSSLIRVYLHKGSCGNTLLRLYTNLQHSFDSAIRLSDEKLIQIDP